VCCPNCGLEKVIRIWITLHTGERLTFHSCHRCEHKWWQPTENDEKASKARGVLPLGEVLTRAKVVKKTA